MKNIFQFCFLFFASVTFAQTGHIMQGVGAVNMSMGGAATAQPLDISGAIHWNPATVSTFDGNIIKLDLGLFFSSPELSSSLPAGALGTGAPAVSGTTKDDRGISPMPALAMVWGKEDSKHTFAASAFGISGFGVTFPHDSNNPLNTSFDPSKSSNPINYPQAAGGFGDIESNYLLFQVGFTWAYELTEKISIGVQPTINYANLELMPNPTANPNATGYPTTDATSAMGFGGQVGVFFDPGNGIKIGASYKTPQYFGDFEFDNTYPDASTATSKFTMNYPAILSFGLGYSAGDFDLAADYRFVDYENTDGFSETGWSPTASVLGFGWKSMSIISAGVQYKGIEKLPIRIGYTYSSNPISNELAFFNVPATAIIKNAVQIGLSYQPTEKIGLDAMYHHGTSGGKTSGLLLNPSAITASNELGEVPGTSVSYEMTTDLISVGISYTFN